MCLFSKRPEWEDDVTFANRRHDRRRRSKVVTETVTRSSQSRPAVQYVQAPPPRVSTPSIHYPSPPPPLHIAPSPPSPPAPRIELVSVEEELRAHSSGPRSSRASVSKKSRHGSRGGGEEVYIERERVRERLPVERPREELETFRYVQGSGHLESAPERRSRSVTYESAPRVSGRVTERERVVIEDGGRRREVYRHP